MRGGGGGEEGRGVFSRPSSLHVCIREGSDERGRGDRTQGGEKLERLVEKPCCVPSSCHRVIQLAVVVEQMRVALYL
ncbi:hypothetical protein JZ751_011726 [Albula glossodonta]|uniref:Uncharacterized protein n=1 Tax=Albula glossodonta TaxID=121402 RepID=A0A8T2PQH0_9TELE|nr:hypothetical protein JZ751_011726 [Albula glossodonta]